MIRNQLLANLAQPLISMTLSVSLITSTLGSFIPLGNSLLNSLFFIIKFNSLKLFIITKNLKAQEYKKLLRLEKQLSNVDLLIIDELSYLTFNRHQSELLFKVVSDRAEKLSVIVSTNLKFSEWTTMFESDTIVSALINRLAFRSNVLNMNGESYREEHSS